MKRIDLENGYVIDRDAYCFSLKTDVKIMTKEDGETYESYTNLGYFKDFASCAKEMAKHMTFTEMNKRNTLKEVIEITKNTDKKIDEVLAKFNKLI